MNVIVEKISPSDSFFNVKEKTHIEGKKFVAEVSSFETPIVNLSAHPDEIYEPELAGYLQVGYLSLFQPQLKEID